MFIQLIKAKVKDREGVQRLSERWMAELRPGAEGFLGATIGITDDGTLVDLARFTSRGGHGQLRPARAGRVVDRVRGLPRRLRRSSGRATTSRSTNGAISTRRASCR